MTRPRLTFARIALVGAGLAGAAGLGTLATPHALAASPAAATATTATPTPAPAVTAPAKKGKHHKATPALRRALVRLVAKDTGRTVKQVRADLTKGESLDTIAGSKAQAVRDAALDPITKRLDAARAAGKITQAQETRRLAAARARIAKLMAATPHPKAATKA